MPSWQANSYSSPSVLVIGSRTVQGAVYFHDPITNTNVPVQGAVAFIPGPGVFAYTDAFGRYRIEGVPVQDMVRVKNVLKGTGTRLVGPNCPGVITAEECKVGIMPGFVFKKGRIGIVSKSGTLTYEAADQVAKAGLGISTAVGIGGDPIIGTTTKEAVEMFFNDPDTDAVVMIGEIGGGMEAEAARWIKENGNKKPVVGFIAGQTAPPGRRMGHAGAIVGGADDTAQAKMKIMAECGIHVAQSPADIGKTMAEIMK